jgi:hypothetical protein
MTLPHALVSFIFYRRPVWNTLSNYTRNETPLLNYDSFI